MSSCSNLSLSPSSLNSCAAYSLDKFLHEAAKGLVHFEKPKFSLETCDIDRLYDEAVGLTAEVKSIPPLEKREKLQKTVKQLQEIIVKQMKEKMSLEAVNVSLEAVENRTIVGKVGLPITCCPCSRCKVIFKLTIGDETKFILFRNTSEPFSFLAPIGNPQSKAFEQYARFVAKNGEK